MSEHDHQNRKKIKKKNIEDEPRKRRKKKKVQQECRRENIGEKRKGGKKEKY